MRAAIHPQHAAELLDISTSLRRAREATKAFGDDVRSLPPIPPPPTETVKGPQGFKVEHFDVFGSGAIGQDMVLLGLRAHGIDLDPETVLDLFERCDADGDGKIDSSEVSALIEQVAALQKGAAWPRDIERLSSAARHLHAQALVEPLTLVAEGEVPTLLRCAASGHAAVEQLGMSALATLAESSHVHCAQAIAARPALADVFSALSRPSLPLPSARQGARLLAALCLEASDAKELHVRRRIRLKLYASAAPLLHGEFGRRCAADAVQAAHTLGAALAAFCTESELVGPLGADGGGGALRLACELARSPSAAARAMGVEAICSCATSEEPGIIAKLVGFGAIPPLVAAAAAPWTVPGSALSGRVDETASRALGLLGYDSLWKGVRGVDPMVMR